MEIIKVKPDEKLAQLIASGTSLVSSKDTATVLGLKPNTLRVWARNRAVWASPTEAELKSNSNNILEKIENDTSIFPKKKIEI